MASPGIQLALAAPLTAIQSIGRSAQLRECQTCACLIPLSYSMLRGAFPRQVSMSISARACGLPAPIPITNAAKFTVTSRIRRLWQEPFHPVLQH